METNGKKGAIKLTTNVRQYTPLGFFNLFAEICQSNDFFISLFKSLNINNNTDLLFNPAIEIDFYEPIGNMQLINLKIQDV